MTAQGTTSSILDTMIGYIRSIFRLIGRVALGGLAIVAAGIVAAAMTVLGLLIAIAAVIFRFTGSAERARKTDRRDGSEQAAGEPGIVLEARKTGQGWTVE